LLLGINLNSYARVEPHTSSFSPHIDSKKTPPLSFEIIEWDKVSTNNSSSSEEDKILACVDEEDDDVNNLSPRKFKSIVGFDPVLFFSSSLNFCESQAHAVHFFWPPVSRRYILLRNLRI